MRLIFMGSPDFAIPSLDALVEAGHNIVAVFTQPDKPKGRGLELAPPPVKTRALELGIEVFQPASVKKEEPQELIKSLKADCIVVVAYGKILPTPILNAAKHGCINVHSSLLPKYRGSAPINWAVVNGETESGVSTMLLDEGMDTGDILLQAKTPIAPDETAGELHDRLAVMGAELIVKTLELAEKGELVRTKQDDALSCHAPMLNKEIAVIDWESSAQSIHNKIRGLSPWPIALCSFGGKKLKIFKSSVAKSGKGAPGEIISLAPFTVACGEGAVVIHELQAEGKKRMRSEDFLRGFRLNVGDILN